MKVAFWKGAVCGAATTAAVYTLLESKVSSSLWPQEIFPADLSHVTEDTEALAQPSGRSCAICALGVPDVPGLRRDLTNHTLFYSYEKRIPLWVQEHLTAAHLKGFSSRENCSFAEDSELDSKWRSNNEDFRNSGWSRGHMAPAGNNKLSLQSMTDTFLLSNIVPQNYKNNSDYWNRFEIYCRTLTEKYTNVYVTSGPAFIPKVLSDNKKVVSYEVIGQHEVAVPTHLYKVIVAEQEDGERALGAFLIPNESIDDDPSLKQFQVPLSQLEARLGFTFYNQLDRSQVADLCEEEGCQIMNRTEFSQYISVRRLRRAQNHQKLQKLWQEFQEKKIPPTPQMKEIYQMKRQEFQLEQSLLAVAQS